MAVSISMYKLNMEFKNSLTNKHMVLPKKHYCKYIYIDAIFDVFDDCGVNLKASANKSDLV